MNIKLKTKVAGNYQDIMRLFDRNLFEALKPKNAKMEIVEFTGSKKGDKVHLRFLSPLKAEWISEITEDGEDESESYFIDEGTTLPFPLSFWKHKHVVQKITEDTSYIIDDMTFKGINSLFTLFLYPALYVAFYPRKSIYKSYFKAQQNIKNTISK
jgi:ligand-binding SRPBCC domain-containing protein